MTEEDNKYKNKGYDGSGIVSRLRVIHNLTSHLLSGFVKVVVVSGWRNIELEVSSSK